MNHKILIATPFDNDKQVLEEALLGFVERGGELLFANKEAEVLEILKKEAPALLLIDVKMVQQLEAQNTKIVWLIENEETHGGETLRKPLSKKQIIEKCDHVFPSFAEAKPYSI